LEIAFPAGDLITGIDSPSREIETILTEDSDFPLLRRVGEISAAWFEKWLGLENCFFPFRFILLLNLGQKDSDSDIPSLLTSDPMAKPKKIELQLAPVMSVCLENFYSFLSSVNIRYYRRIRSSLE
jgi:hypothetical protein